ncbi:MAG: hypothetical protein KAT88_13050, partial [Spirochaetes bacterium]|nr:hypothetical protein [Spirochaetota bacterium]
MNKFRNFKLISLVCILAFALVFIGFNFLQAQGKPDKDKPPGKPKPPAPELSLDYGDIVTAESDALSVWSYSDSSSDSIWTTETQSYYYSDVAVGDVDSDGYKEIVVPVVKEMKSPGPNAGPFQISIDVYKEGSEIPLSSEYFIDASRVICDITVANVIPEGLGKTIINEIVLLHWYNLVIFQWDESNSNFRIVKQIEARKKDLLLLCFNGMTTKNIDNDEEEEIFVSGGDTYYGAGKNYTGYIYMIDMYENAGYNRELKGSTKDFGLGHSLRVANLDGDNDFEICLPGLVENRLDVSLWKAYLLVLDPLNSQNWQWTIIPGYKEEKNVYPYIKLDVGELDSGLEGKEIALCVNQQHRSDYYLYIFKYPFTNNNVFSIGYPLQDADS